MKTDSLINKLAKDVKPVNKLRHPFIRFLFCILVAGIFVGGSVYFIGIRHDIIDAVDNKAFIAEILAALATGFLSALTANWLAIPDVRQQKWVVWLPFFPLSFFVFMASYQFIIQPIHLAMPEAGAACVLDIIWLISLPAIVLFILLRRAATTHTKMASFMAVLSVLSFGYLCARLVCANDNLPHLLFWHYLPILIIGVFGAVMGSKILRW
jgi:hypothetical protein